MMIKNLTYPHEINIALLKTKKPMRFNKKLKPIKMATFVPEEGSTAVMSGYGYNGVRLCCILLCECVLSEQNINFRITVTQL